MGSSRTIEIIQMLRPADLFLCCHHQRVELYIEHQYFLRQRWKQSRPESGHLMIRQQENFKHWCIEVEKIFILYNIKY